MEPVATGDEVAIDLANFSVVAKMDCRAGTARTVQTHRLGLEVYLTTDVQPSFDEVLDYLLLAVDGNGAAAGQVKHVDAMSAPVEAQLDSVMNQAFALQTVAQASFYQQIDRALFQHAGTYALLT